MKKWIISLVALMLLTAFAVPALAANTEIAITSSNTTVYAGDEITVTVSVSTGTPYTSVGMTPSYNAEVLEIVRVDPVETGGINVPYDGISFGFYFLNNPTSYSGAFQTIVFKVKGGAAVGQTTISGTPSGAATAVKPLTLTIACNHKYTNWTHDETNHTGTCANGCGVPKTEAHNWPQSGTVITPAGCETTGTERLTCTVCGRTKDVPIAAKGHAYDNACDTTCNNCGSTRATSHKYRTTWSSDGKNHWHECSTCGSKKDSAAHTPGAAATETTAQTCTVCSYVIQPALGHVHQFDDTWQQNSDYHWHVCKREGCHDTQGKAYHDYDNNCDLTCNTCGHVRVAPHELGTELRGDERGHWYVCILCNEPSEILPHTPGEPATMDTPQVCTECQYWVKFPLSHVHTWGETWEVDDMNHWRACVECREPSDAQPHAWDAGTVLIEPTKNSDGKISFVCEECKIERTATIPKLEPDPNETTEPTQTQPIKPSDNSEEFPWWILIVAAGVLLIAGIALFVFEFIRSKKYNSHGKFSSK